MKRFSSILTFSLIFFISHGQIAQFAGPNRDQVYTETGLMDKWPENGPELLGTISGLGLGYAAPAINEMGLFIAGTIDSTGYIFHVDHNGALVWKYEYGKEFTYRYPGSRGTPTVEENRLYYSGTFGDAVCLNATTGEVIWKKNILEEYGGPTVKWGYTESPLIYKDLVYLTPGGPGNNIVAFNKYSGEPVWSIDLENTFNSYCSPVLIKHAGKEMILMNTSIYLLLIEPLSGKILFKTDISNSRSYNAIAPLYHEGKIFYSSGYGVGSTLYMINDEAGTLDTIYSNSDLDCKVSGMILYDGTVFGAADRKKQWVGIDFETGETRYQSRDLKPGSFLQADNKFFIFTDMGEVALVNPHKDGFNIISRFFIPVQPASTAFTHPVLYRGILYIRYLGDIWLYKVKQ